MATANKEVPQFPAFFLFQSKYACLIKASGERNMKPWHSLLQSKHKDSAEHFAAAVNCCRKDAFLAKTKEPESVASSSVRRGREVAELNLKLWLHPD